MVAVDFSRTSECSERLCRASLGRNV